jgi:hypothetical protein
MPAVTGRSSRRQTASLSSPVWAAALQRTTASLRANEVRAAAIAGRARSSGTEPRGFAGSNGRTA